MTYDNRLRLVVGGLRAWMLETHSRFWILFVVSTLEFILLMVKLFAAYSEVMQSVYIYKYNETHKLGWFGTCDPKCHELHDIPDFVVTKLPKFSSMRFSTVANVCLFFFGFICILLWKTLPEKGARGFIQRKGVRSNNVLLYFAVVFWFLSLVCGLTSLIYCISIPKNLGNVEPGRVLLIMEATGTGVNGGLWLTATLWTCRQSLTRSCYHLCIRLSAPKSEKTLSQWPRYESQRHTSLSSRSSTGTSVATTQKPDTLSPPSPTYSNNSNSNSLGGEKSQQSQREKTLWLADRWGESYMGPEETLWKILKMRRDKREANLAEEQTLGALGRSV